MAVRKTYRKKRIVRRRPRRVGMGFFGDVWRGIKSVARPVAKIASPLVGMYNPMAGAVLGGIGGMGRQRRTYRRKTTVRRRPIRRVRRTTTVRRRRVSGRGVFSSLWNKLKPVLSRVHANVKKERLISRSIGNNTVGRLARTLGYGRSGRGLVAPMSLRRNLVRF